MAAGDKGAWKARQRWRLEFAAADCRGDCFATATTARRGRDEDGGIRNLQRRFCSGISFALALSPGRFQLIVQLYLFSIDSQRVVEAGGGAVFSGHAVFLRTVL